MTQVKLLLRLRQKQLDEHLTNSAFAKKLGISRALWALTLMGLREVRLLLLCSTVRNYPDLIPDVIEFLRNSHEPT